METVTSTNQEQAARILIDAFADDPVMNWIGRHKPGWVPFLFEVTLPVFVPGGLTYITADGSGAAAWKGPEGVLNWPVRMSHVVKALRLAGPSGLYRFAMSGKKTEKYHPHEPHYYLFAIGALQECRGQGVGSRLMSHILRRCDDEGMPAYLENSKEANLPFYRGHGFEVTREIRFARDAPPMWLMWREPKKIGSD
jgi:ribosomal protein S18 acetylase RimI-like enzyme